MMLVSLQGAEEGVEQARTIADPQALNLATDEHERAIQPLRAKAATLTSSSDAARAGIQETTRTLREYEARLKSLEAQQRSNDAVIAVAERNHATYISQLCAQGSSQRPPPAHAASRPPAPANHATFVVPAAQQPPATVNLATFVVPAATQPLGTTAPATARVSATTAPAVTFSARTDMPPPAPRESSTSTTPWSVVVSRTHRQPLTNRPTPLPTTHTWASASPN